MSNQENKNAEEGTNKEEAIKDTPTTKNPENERQPRTTGGSESTQTTFDNSGMGADQVQDDDDQDAGSNTFTSR